MQNIFNGVEEDFKWSRNGTRVVCYLKAEVVFVGALALWAERLGGVEAVAWALGPGQNLCAAAVLLAGCQQENLGKYLR